MKIKTENREGYFRTDTSLRGKDRRAKRILTIGPDVNVPTLAVALELQKEFMSRNLSVRIISTGRNRRSVAEREAVPDTIENKSYVNVIRKEIERIEQQGAEYTIVEYKDALLHLDHSNETAELMRNILPDAIILCCRFDIDLSNNDIQIDYLERSIRILEDVVDAVKVVGIGMTSDGLTDEQSVAEEKRIEIATGLPVIDASRFGGQKLTDALLGYFLQLQIEENTQTAIC